MFSLCTSMEHQIDGLIADKPIKRNRSFRAQIEVQLGRFLQRACGQHACLMMLYIRRTVYTLMVSAVLPVAPFNRLIVQIGKFSKYTALKEVLLHEADEALYGSFGKRVPRLAKPGVESYVSHKELIIVLPDGLSLGIPADHHTLHVVCQYLLRNTHKQERMNHSDEEVFLPGIWKELDIALSTAATDHGKACDLSRIAVPIINIHESPIHLVAFAWF